MTLFSHWKEGRKEEEEEEGRNPHLASSRRIDPTCLNFGDCLVGDGGCMEIVWRVSGGCLESAWRLSGVYLWDV